MARRATGASHASSSSSYVDASTHAGFVNLGNTCFLNSVLQATSATQSLRHLYHPDDLLDDDELLRGRAQLSSPALPNDGTVSADAVKQLLLRSKSPVLQLTDEEHGRNFSRPASRRPSSTVDPSIAAALLGKARAGEKAEASNASSARSSLDARAYEPSSSDLPLNTVFRQVLEKAWKAAPSSKTPGQKVPAVNPKRLLSIMASKYDQYGEYGQQDGHELLRHLLDSLRMEELDVSLCDRSGQRASLKPALPTQVIKKIQPPIPSERKRRHRQGAALVNAPDSDKEKLEPFVDSLFCGKLLSCVVCEGCRHVSHTYEDFYDISLSLRPENDAKGAGKRDRMRSMADRWKRATSGKQASNGNSSHAGPSKAANDSLALLTDGMMGSVSDTEESEEKVKRSASKSGRSIVRPKSAAAGQSPAMMDANSRESAKAFMMKSMQPEGAQSGSDLEVEKASGQSEEKKREGTGGQGAVALLRAVSRSRPPSRSASPMREEINQLVEANKGHHHLMRHDHKPKQSKQGAYLARLLVEAPLPTPLAPTSALLWGRRAAVPSPSEVQSEGAAKRGAEGMDIEAQQANTGLVRALHQFTNVEVLDGANSFACKRCWRILNPPTEEEEAKLRLRRVRRGKNESESERSSDDEASSDEEAEEQSQPEQSHTSRSPSAPPAGEASTVTRKRPPVSPHLHSNKTVTADEVLKLQASLEQTSITPEIPSIETTSPQTPSSDSVAEHMGTTPPDSAPLLKAPKAVMAGSKGITLGETLSSASSDDGSVSGISATTTGESSDESEEEKGRSIKFVDRLATSSTKLGGQVTKGLLRKRSMHSLQRRALKRFLLAETPKVFVFHFKRFQASGRFSSYSFSSNFKKIDDYVSFPEYLDVKPWLAPPREEYNRHGNLKASSDPKALEKAHREAEQKSEQEKEKRHGRWQWRPHTPGREGQEANRARMEAGSKTKYKLYAVVVHQGSMSGGHYTAYVLSDRLNGQNQTKDRASSLTPLTAASNEGASPVPTAMSSEGGGSGLRSSISISSLGSELGGVSDVNSTATASTSAGAALASDADGTSIQTNASAPSLTSAASASNAARPRATSGEKEDRRRWIYASDTVVRPASIDEVLRAQAYMLFYEQM